MAHIIEDRVLELSTSTGSGAFALAGALTGFRALSAVMSVADTCWYYIEAIDADGDPTGAYEWGLGTYSAVNELTRTTVRGSSNGGAAVVFAAGNKLVGMGVQAPSASANKLEWRTALAAAGLGDANTFTKAQVVTPVALTAGATVNIDASLSNNFTLTPNQNFTLAAPTNPTNGQVINVVFTQGGTPYTITFNAAWQFAGGVEPALTAAANAVDFMSCYYNGATSKWICVMNLDFKA